MKRVVTEPGDEEPAPGDHEEVDHTEGRLGPRTTEVPADAIRVGDYVIHPRSPQLKGWLVIDVHPHTRGRIRLIVSPGDGVAQPLDVRRDLVLRREIREPRDLTR